MLVIIIIVYLKSSPFELINWFPGWSANQSIMPHVNDVPATNIKAVLFSSTTIYILYLFTVSIPLIPEIIVFHLLCLQFDEGKAVFSGDWTAESISVFVQAEELPLVVTFSDQVCQTSNRCRRFYLTYD